MTASTAAATRLDARVDRLTPLVGRERERGELLEAWHECAGAGRVVLLSGQPGIGKSRLAHELYEHVVAGGHRAVRLRCSPYHRNSALYPLLRPLERAVPPDGTRAERRARLDAELERCGLARAGIAELLAELLAIPSGEATSSGEESAQRRKRRTLDALQAWLVAQGEGRPLLVVVEDVHWIDPSTLELIGRFFAPEPLEGVLLLVTHRDEFVPPWPHRSFVRRLALDHLRPADVHEVVDRLTGGRPLPEAVEVQIALRADGVPLYVEELTRTVLESGAVQERGGRLVAAGTLPERLVPSTLRESLMARLDRLGDAREVAQVLAVQGRDVGADFLAAISQLDRDRLEDGLDQLLSADLVRRREAAGEPTYAYKHSLIRDVAYESMLRSTRRRLHERTAAELASGWYGVRDTRPEVIGQHLVAAGLGDQAIPYLRRAGALASRRSATTEAIVHLSTALELLRERPAGSERDHEELSLLLALGAPLTAANGYSAPRGRRRLPARRRAVRHDGRRDAGPVPGAVRHVARHAAARRVRGGSAARPAVGGSRHPQRPPDAHGGGPPGARQHALLHRRGRTCGLPAPRAGDRLGGATRRSHELHRRAARRARSVDRLPRVPGVGAVAARASRTPPGG